MVINHLGLIAGLSNHGSDMNFPARFNDLFLRHWNSLLEKTQTKAGPICIDGHNLDLASVLLVAR